MDYGFEISRKDLIEKPIKARKKSSNRITVLGKSFQSKLDACKHYNVSMTTARKIEAEHGVDFENAIKIRVDELEKREAETNTLYKPSGSFDSFLYQARPQRI